MTDLDAAWQAALAAEHEAVFGYGLLGPRLTGPDRSFAASCANAHVQLRNATSAALVSAGLTPVAPLADYPALYPVPNAGAARRLAVRLEERSAAAWRYLYAQAAFAGATARIAQAQAALTASAVRATQWRVLINPADATRPFPGIARG